MPAGSATATAPSHSSSPLAIVALVGYLSVSMPTASQIDPCRLELRAASPRRAKLTARRSCALASRVSPP